MIHLSVAVKEADGNGDRLCLAIAEMQKRDLRVNWFLQRPSWPLSALAALVVSFRRAGIAVAVAVRQNRSTMKMTIFKGSEIEVEKEINNWLKAERINKSSPFTHVNYGATVYITVWWHHLDTGKNPPMAHGVVSLDRVKTLGFRRGLDGHVRS